MNNQLPAYLQQAAIQYKLEQARKASGVKLPTPTLYPLQSAIVNTPHKRVVVACGRRVGKTLTAANIAVGGKTNGGRGLVDGKRVLYVSTSYDQTDAFWRRVKDYLAPLYSRSGFYKNETRRIIEYNGGSIQVRTGHNPGSLRSDYCDTLLLDECAFLDPDAWHTVGMPMLIDTNGAAYFFSTPNRRNWFWELYVNATADTVNEWIGYNFSTLENPHLPQSALEQLISDMSQERYQQEILAQFLEGSGAVFRRVDECATLSPREPYAGRFVFGVDWAQSADYTVIAIMDADSKQLVAYDRFTGVSWALQRGRLRALYDAWKPETILAESNSIGSVNIEALQNEGLPVRSFETTASSKPPLIENLVLAFERLEIAILKDPIVTNELKAYERIISKATGRSQYSAPSGMHDDCVMALALAWSECNRPAARGVVVLFAGND